MERCLRRRNIYIPKGVPNASEVFLFFPEKSSEGVLKPIVEQKSCDEKRTSSSSKQGKQLSLLDKREYPKGEGV